MPNIAGLQDEMNLDAEIAVEEDYQDADDRLVDSIGEYDREREDEAEVDSRVAELS